MEESGVEILLKHLVKIARKAEEASILAFNTSSDDPNKQHLCNLWHIEENNLQSFYEQAKALLKEVTNGMVE